MMTDRRRFERVQFFCEVSIAILPDGPTISAHSVDVSLGGAGLVTQVAIELGQSVALSFSLGNQSGEEIENRVMARVVNFRADPDVNHIGVEFLELLSHSRNPHLLKKFLKT